MAYTTRHVNLRFDNRLPLPYALGKLLPPQEKKTDMSEEWNLVWENPKTILLTRMFEDGGYATACHSSILRLVSTAQILEGCFRIYIPFTKLILK